MLKRLETHHMIALQILALPKRGGMTMDEIATEAGVSRRVIYDWIQDPLFDRELKKEIVRQTTARLPEIMESLTEAVIKDHNAAAAKLLLQVNGMLTDKIEVETKVSDATDTDALRAKLEAFRARKEEA
jgi:AcrR family transcriptional regulator